MNEEFTNLSKMNREISQNQQFDLKSKRISILKTYGDNFNEKEFIIFFYDFVFIYIHITCICTAV